MLRSTLLRWVTPLLVAFSLSGAALAHEDHHGGKDDDGGVVFSKDFAKSFIGKQGADFSKVFSFNLDSSSTFNGTFFSTGFDELIGVLVTRGGSGGGGGAFRALSSAPTTTSFDLLGSPSFSQILGPGHYSFIVLGTVGAPFAFVAGNVNAAPVPEPAEWMMIIAGIGMIGLVVSRRRSV